MATKSTTFLALLLTFNLLSFTLTSACGSGCPTPKPTPKPTPTPTPTPSSSGSCPTDALKFGVCADVLNIIKGVKVGTPPTTTCCPLLEGLVNLEAAVCLCTAIKANVLGINLNVPVDLSLILNYCGNLNLGFVFVFVLCFVLFVCLIAVWFNLCCCMGFAWVVSWVDCVGLMLEYL
ncbi:hypothetical protein LUZ60_016802 [Juncus effusus]|nr:hypothetical protein LUZ60_016802 [Juncus effusus]